MDIPLPPLPSSELEWFWFLVAAFFTRALTKNADQEMQKSEWFLKLSPMVQLLLKRLMDMFHHWPLGWFLTLYPGFIANWLKIPAIIVIMIGSGIFYDDIPDFVRYVNWFREYIEYLKKKVRGNNEQ